MLCPRYKPQRQQARGCVRVPTEREKGARQSSGGVRGGESGNGEHTPISAYFVCSMLILCQSKVPQSQHTGDV